jgi:hypothetical protein
MTRAVIDAISAGEASPETQVENSRCSNTRIEKEAGEGLAVFGARQ